MTLEKKYNRKIGLKSKKRYQTPLAKITKISLGVWGGSGSSSGSCLPPYTKIATPSGNKSIRTIKVGQIVWTINKKGRKLATLVVKVSKTKVSKTHQMIHLALSDGRKLIASPDHPVIGDRKIRQLHVGEYYDHSRILDISLITYHNNYTYDILPDGDTGYYWADGILIASTLHTKNQQKNYHLITKVFSSVSFSKFPNS